jgi:hypothetical protein
MRALTLHLIGYWGYLWCLFFLAGFAGLRLVHRFVPRSLNTYRASDVVWFGIATVTWLGLIVSLNSPLADGFHAAVAAAALVYALCDRRALAAYAARHLDAARRHGNSLGWRAALAGGLAMAIVLYAALGANGAPASYDTLLYHAQSVRWLKEYGTVQGLANLNSRIGFNNSWFVTAAFADAGAFTFKSYHVIDPFVYTLTLVTLAVRLAHGLGGPWRIGWVFDAVMLYPLLHYRFYINSLSTDVASALVTVQILSHFLHRYDSDACRHEDLCWAAVVLSFAATIKLINLPMLLLAVLAGLTLPPAARWRHAAGCALLGGLVWLPWLARGYLLSGYLLYPFHALDLFSPDWKVPRGLAVSEQNWIRSWARLPGLPPEQVLGKGLQTWFEAWMNRSRASLVGFTSWGVTGLVVTVVFLRPVMRQVLRIWPVLLTVAVSLLYWFIQAPDVRFGYGYLTAMTVLILSLILMVALGTGSERGRRVLATVFVTSLALHLHGELSEDLNERCRSLGRDLTDYPRAVLQPHTYASGLTVAVPVRGDLCINEPLPCSPGTERGTYDLSLRGATLRDGFRLRPRSAPTPTSAPKQ